MSAYGTCMSFLFVALVFSLAHACVSLPLSPSPRPLILTLTLRSQTVSHSTYHEAAEQALYLQPQSKQKNQKKISKKSNPILPQLPTLTRNRTVPIFNLQPW